MIPSPRARGFTLIEVLVALALMSLIGTILIESLRVAGHTWQRVTREAGNIDEITRAQDFLRQRLAAVQPPKPAGVSGILSGSGRQAGVLQRLTRCLAWRTGALLPGSISIRVSQR
jgi:prepilin-type N-terminal cleavage/methylation domain-containing protein